jgi:GNAT superfamily N-acetyltransferase
MAKRRSDEVDLRQGGRARSYAAGDDATPVTPRIREAVRSDVDRILPLMEAYWAFEQAQGFESDRIRRQLEDFLSTPKFGRAWVAEEGERVVAYVVAAYVYSFEYGGPMAELDELFVVEGYRGRGLGRALIATACKALERHGCVVVQLQVADWNEAGQRFYGREGFAPKSGYRLWVAPLGAVGSPGA